MSNVSPSLPEDAASPDPAATSAADSAVTSAGPSAGRKKRKIPALVWVLLIWGAGSWILWHMMMRPEVPPLEEGLLALAERVPADIGLDTGMDMGTVGAKIGADRAPEGWLRDYQARLLTGEKKHADPAHRDAHRVLCIREAVRAGRLDMACATARSIEGPAKRDEVLGDLIPQVAADCQNLPLAVWSALTLHGKDARKSVHTLLNERWDECPR